MARQIKPVTLATELSMVEADIVKLEAQLKPLEAAKDKLREELLKNLQMQGVKQVKLDSGVMYVRAHKTTLKVVNEEAAKEWAGDHNAMKVDTSKTWQILKLTGMTDDVPLGFERQDTEYLSVRKAGASDDV